jgi:hypothetical protein
MKKISKKNKNKKNKNKVQKWIIKMKKIIIHMKMKKVFYMINILLINKKIQTNFII